MSWQILLFLFYVFKDFDCSCLAFFSCIFLHSFSHGDLTLTIFRSSRFSSQRAGAGGASEEAEGEPGGGQEEEARGAQAARENLLKFFIFIFYFGFLFSFNFSLIEIFSYFSCLIVIIFFQALQAQKFREQQELERRRHIEQLRTKDMDRRQAVEERRKELETKELERKEAIIAKNRERETRQGQIFCRKFVLGKKLLKKRYLAV